ncbi:zinc finger CCHC domain-containing protein 12-like [Nothobranchius furzeri]|uniref:zinc finger CCHC domain-containing protein 12-like n=1 Tax=Nothobranchius furzeri TaxID=105023 RepID=UPI0039048761
MEFIANSGIKVPNAVIVSGLLGSPEDEEIIDFLKKYGSARLVSVTDAESEFYKNLIIEYQDGAAIEALSSLLPYTHELKENPSVRYLVQALASIYTTKVGCNVTKTYLNEIKKLAKLSGKEYEEVLRDMMSEISEAIGTGSADEVSVAKPFNTSLETVETSDHQMFRSPSLMDFGQDCPEPKPPTILRQNLPIRESDLHPPEVQKVIVEHIVRKSDCNIYPHFPIKLHPFSGKTPRPSNETDYDTWRSHAELLRKDSTLSNLQKSRKMVESLLSPAADIVKRLSPEATPETYLQLLDAAFGTVEDGEELFAQFMNTLQDPGEKALSYLCRLQAVLNLAVKRGGIAAEEADKYILKKFCRGCWDNILLSDLNLEDKKSHPPAFAELLLQIRTEEDRHAAKVTRMKKHLGSNRQRAVTSSQSTCACSQQVVIPPESNTLEELRQQVASLQSQLTALMSKKPQKTSKPKGSAEHASSRPISPKLDPRAPSWKPSNPKQNARPKAWYCFKCGQDGHISSTCTNELNPTLVDEKRSQLREKQRLWDATNHLTPNENF